jgi:hypothetical protein
MFNEYLNAVPGIPVAVWSTLRRLLMGLYNEQSYKADAHGAIVVVDQAALSSGFFANPTDYTFDAAKMHTFAIQGRATDPNAYQKKAASIPPP